MQVPAPRKSRRGRRSYRCSSPCICLSPCLHASVVKFPFPTLPPKNTVSEQNTPNPERRMRAIRSFVLREGRLTPGQQRALDELYPRYGLELEGKPLDFAALFGRAVPVVLEIGFGNGESLAAMAQAHPERGYLGIEVHRPGVGHLLMQIEREGIENLRVAN